MHRGWHSASMDFIREMNFKKIEVGSRKEAEQGPGKQRDVIDEIHDTLRKMVELKEKIMEIQKFGRQLYPNRQQPIVAGDIFLGDVLLPSFTA